MATRRLTSYVVGVVLGILGLAVCFAKYDSLLPGSVPRTVLRSPEGFGVARSWAELFGPARRIDLETAELDIPLLAVVRIWVENDGDLVIADGLNSRILVFDRKGGLRHSLGSKGQGPGEFNILSHVTADASGKLIAYDVDGYRLSELVPPDYRLGKTYSVGMPVSGLVSSNEDLIVYSPYGRSLLTKFAQGGKKIGTTLKTGQEALRLFLCRFQTGGIAPDGHGGVFAIYPEDFSILHYDKDLNLLARYSGGSSPWRPASPRFPESLSPYDYTTAHGRWWDTHLHIETVFNLGPELLGVTLFKSQGISPVGTHLNVYSKQGEIVGEGLPVPLGGRVVAAKGCKVWTARNATLDAEGQMTPLAVFEHSIQPRGKWAERELCDDRPGGA